MLVSFLEPRLVFPSLHGRRPRSNPLTGLTSPPRHPRHPPAHPRALPLQASKAAIYSLHRSDMAEAHKQIVAAEAVITDLHPLVAADPALRAGSFSAALEEYAEAGVLRYFLQTGAVLPHRLLPVCDRDEYLGGLLDFAGELNRFAVARATRRDVASVQHCREVLDALNGQFVQCSFRNGALRQKYDSLKYSLQKVENLLYELSLRSGATDVAEIVDKARRAGICACGRRHSRVSSWRRWYRVTRFVSLAGVASAGAGGGGARKVASRRRERSTTRRAVDPGASGASAAEGRGAACRRRGTRGRGRGRRRSVGAAASAWGGRKQAA